jgi:2-polyprenyl-3-methyl-5-hydroxy-6-metoxy-1,4-benzoquinol methylase
VNHVDTEQASSVPLTAARYRRNRREYGTHEVVLRQVPPQSAVLDVGCATGYLAEPLRARGCRVWGIDRDATAAASAAPMYEDTRVIDLDECNRLPWPEQFFDVVLCADVIEHLRDPAAALRLVRRHLSREGRLVLSVPNVAHFSTRIPLLFGRFDYTPTGILDETHLRLFTFRSARALVESSGFAIQRIVGTSDHFGALLHRMNGASRLVRGMLAYNIIVVATPKA